MPLTDTLPSDQRAVIELVLRRGRSYRELAGLLSVDLAAVRRRASDAALVLAPSALAVPPEHALITDYLLGQLPPNLANDIRELLAGSPSARAWAGAVSNELVQFAPGAVAPLPELSHVTRERPPKPRRPADVSDGVALEPGAAVEPETALAPEVAPEPEGSVEPETTLAPEPAVAPDTAERRRTPAAEPADTGQPTPEADAYWSEDFDERGAETDAAATGRGAEVAGRGAEVAGARPVGIPADVAAAGDGARTVERKTVPPRRSPSANQRRGKRGRGPLVVALAIVLLAVVAVVVLLAHHSSSHRVTLATSPTQQTTSSVGTESIGQTSTTGTGETATTATATTGTTTASTSTTGGTRPSGSPTIAATVAMNSPAGYRTTVGVAQIVVDSGNHRLVLRASGLPANGTADAYAVWLYHSPTVEELVGFIADKVTTSGTLYAAGDLPSDFSLYTRLLLTLERSPHPVRPGTVVLAGNLPR